MLGHSFNVMASVIQARDAELSNAQERLRRAVAAAREASQMKSNFLSNMSHEIRTPLNGLIGMLALLAETEMTGEQREYVELASASGDALMTVVNDVLDIAKIEAGRLEIESRDFDLDEMVESSCEMVAAGARIKGIELQSYVHDEVPRAVRGDRVRVSQILVNLLSNAVKFTPAGEVVAEVTLGHLSETGASVIFSVRDTGIGIPPERLEHLFEPFTQAEAGTTREFGGTGLGLSISRELAQLMGGTLHARSEVATGSTFQFEIPFARAETDLAGPVPSAELRGLRVLIVDDNETNRRIFEAYVESWGMRATCAADANTAFAHLRHAIEAGTPFDVALLDQNLPGESGVELARRITAAPTLGGTRLILLSSSAAEESWPGVQFACQLTKPVRRSRLLDAISAAMAAGPAGGRSTAPTVSGAGAPPGTGSVRLGCRILVAEDQPTNWMLIDRLLSKRGHVTANAADGEETLRRFDSEAYDLILMDCQMPRCDGYDTAREIRRREGAANGRRTPIIALTAHSMAGDRERCLAAGMDDYLAKPIRAEELDQVLARWLPAPEPPVPADADPLTSETLDPARLAKLRGLFSDEELAGVLRQLMADITEELEGIEAAVRDGDPDEAAAAAHRLRNSALLVGANQLIDAAAPLERSSAEGASDLRGVDSNVIGRLRRHWEMTRLAIENELEPTSP